MRAYAKVNLTLEVLDRRQDRYHELRSVVQTVSLADELSLRRNSPGTKLLLRGYPVPSGDDNLVMTALRQGQALFGISRDVELTLMKNIPPGRGMGGGSSDAAAVLSALGCLYSGEIPFSQLHSIAAEVGSDVPLFLEGGTVLMAGRGERLDPLVGSDTDYTLLLAWPALGVPTEVAYSLLVPEDYASGERTERLVAHLRAGGRPEPELLCNCFERAVFARWPAIAQLHEQVSALAGVPARLAGSGSGIFALTEQAEELALRLREQGYGACAVRPVDRGQELSCPPRWREEGNG